MLNEVKSDVVPYVGPRPFEPRDRNLFFGRDRETLQIISLILSNPLTLIYSQSGVGKTSLFNAKIVFELRTQYKFHTFPSARVRSLTSQDKMTEGIDNIYMYNALRSMESDIDSELLKRLTLSSFLKQHPSRPEVPSTEMEAEGKPIPQLIVFDQLEEIFGLYSENWRDQQRDFFQQIADVLNEDNLLRIVFVIREDYLAYLSPFAHLLPRRLGPHFRLERLGRESAIQAVSEPLKNTGRFFAPGVTEKLVDDLLIMRVENMFGAIVEMKGEYVEPVHLQVVCQRLWKKVVAAGITEITEVHLKGTADVNEALTEFYLEVILDASKRSGENQTLLKTSSLPEPIVLDDSKGTIQLATTLDDHTLKNITARALLTDDQKVSPLSDPIEASLGLGEVRSSDTSGMK